MISLSTCAPPVPGSGPDLSGVLDLNSGWLGVDSAAESEILEYLRAVQHDTLNLYTGLLGRDTISFSLHRPNGPLDMFVAPFGIYDSMIVKIYTSAKCGKTHAGFRTGCIGTFGRHRAFGNSMEWSVQNWKNCAQGDTVCVERYRQVGTITYYQGFNCMDTLFTTQPIMRYRCD